MHTSSRGLAFLLSLGSLPLACTKDDGDTDGESTTTTVGTTGGATDPGQSTSTTDPTTGATDPTDTSSTPPTSSTTSSSSSTTDEDPGHVTDGPPPDSNPACVAYAANAVACEPSNTAGYDEIIMYCEYYMTYGKELDGQACADAFNALYVCYSQLNCADLNDENSDGCPAESAAIITACPNFTESGDTDTDTGDTTSTGG